MSNGKYINKEWKNDEVTEERISGDKGPKENEEQKLSSIHCTPQINTNVHVHC